MRNVVRFAVETVLLMFLACGMLFAAIAAARWIFSDEKSQYFIIGYYVAIHANLVRWIWKKLGIEKAATEKATAEKAAAEKAAAEKAAE